MMAPDWLINMRGISDTVRLWYTVCMLCVFALTFKLDYEGGVRANYFRHTGATWRNVSANPRALDLEYIRPE